MDWVRRKVTNKRHHTHRLLPRNAKSIFRLLWDSSLEHSRGWQHSSSHRSIKRLHKNCFKSEGQGNTVPFFSPKRFLSVGNKEWIFQLLWSWRTLWKLSKSPITKLSLKSKRRDTLCSQPCLCCGSWCNGDITSSPNKEVPPRSTKFDFFLSFTSSASAELLSFAFRLLSTRMTSRILVPVNVRYSFKGSTQSGGRCIRLPNSELFLVPPGNEKEEQLPCRERLVGLHARVEHFLQRIFRDNLLPHGFGSQPPQAQSREERLDVVQLPYL